MARTWNEQLADHLNKQCGSSKGKILFAKYHDVFQRNYLDIYSVSRAVSDILLIERLTPKKPFEIDFYTFPDLTESGLHLRLIQLDKEIPLSDILPMFENMGLRTLNETPTQIKLKDKMIFISDFSVEYLSKSAQAIEEVESIFQDAFINIIFGNCENDGFNKLVLGAGLTWRQITIIRAYAKYLHQVRFRFSQLYIEKIVIDYADIAKLLIELFETKFNPQQKKTKNDNSLAKKILELLDAITTIDEDRIMRRFLQLIQVTLRTNYFQNKDSEYLCFKFKSQEVPELPLPHPLYEIFVYSPRFEAIHLRAAKVARGGIRWSDRREDFRTEILGLMKAQKVKNAVIVPSGAKGGFVLKKLRDNASREETQAEVIYCYKAFMCSLLDITDNIVKNKVVRPPSVVCYDDEDPYLVVAADKGTAAFSDIANGIAIDYGFWLGDAFASGGSTGYDHKKMGITARGAWESIKRHFRELNIDLSKTEITAIGIGDMSGDVFGNGMIYTSKLKLIAAFDYRHIFIDPTPHPEKSYQERLRLFNLPTSSWEDYNPKLISKGGGVFKRTSKSITLTPQMKACLDVQANTLTPNELIKAILKAPVDLFYNGGIGTYVKATHESHADVGDKTNEFTRVNGGELRCRIVGEGGNLGLTQLGRIEYALKGGLINTDFIDNSAGVDCSDHEVNIKILLDSAVKSGKLKESKRNQLLASMTQEVADLVLKDNYCQALAMSYSSLRTNHYTGLYQTYLKDLETLGVIDRNVEYLPNDEELLRRKTMQQGLTRPEVAVLLAYTKIHIQNEILKSDLPEDSYFAEGMTAEFPNILDKNYRGLMGQHRLHREIIATQLSNHIVNQMGITFVYRLAIETGASIPEIIKAHAICSRIYEVTALERVIEGLSEKIAIELQYELLHYVRLLLNVSTRWFIRSQYIKQDVAKVIKHFAPQIAFVKKIIPTVMSGTTREYLEKLADHFIESGLTKNEAHGIAVYRALYISLNIIEVATQYHFDLTQTTKVYFDVGSRFNLVWFRDQISTDAREGHWNSLARLTLRDELDLLQRSLTVAIMRRYAKNKDHVTMIDKWLQLNSRLVVRWDQLLSLLHNSTDIDYTMFFVALRELSNWIYGSELGDDSTE